MSDRLFYLRQEFCNELVKPLTLHLCVVGACGAGISAFCHSFPNDSLFVERVVAHGYVGAGTAIGNFVWGLVGEVGFGAATFLIGKGILLDNRDAWQFAKEIGTVGSILFGIGGAIYGYSATTLKYDNQFKSFRASSIEQTAPMISAPVRLTIQKRLIMPAGTKFI